MLPVFMGLLACIPTFPVPVGDPEKSSIDPDISGVWLTAEEAVFYVFEPYDKRTWLVTAFRIEQGDGECAAAADGDASTDAAADESPGLSHYDEVFAGIAEFGTECFKVERAPSAVKAWRTKLGGEWFMTWEDKGTFDAETEFERGEWLVFRIDKSVPGQLRLHYIDLDHEAWNALEDVDEGDVTRQQVERVLRKHAHDPDFYDEDLVAEFDRVAPEHYELIEEFMDQGMIE